MKIPNRKSKILILALMCITSQGFANEPLTWEDCLREAGERNATLISAKESVNRAEAQVSSSHSPFLPQLTGSASYTQSGSEGPASVNAPLGSASTQDQYSFGVTTSVNLFNGFRDSAQLGQSKATRDSQKAALQAQRATVHQDLKKAFAQLLYAQTVLSLNEEIEKRRKDNVDLVEMRFQGGRENKGSFLRSQASHRQAKFDVSQGTRNLRVAQKQLARLLGRDLLEPISIKGELATKPVPKQEMNFRELAKQTPNAIQSSFEFKVAQEGVTKAWGAFYPALNLSGSLSRTGEEFFPTANRWSAGVTLTVPIFQWGNFADVGAARAEERRAEVIVRNSEEQAGVRLEETFAALANAVERVEVQEQVVAAAKLRSEISKGQYSTGNISYNDWDIIENDLITQQQSLLSVRRDAVSAEANWEQALGKGDLP